MKIVWYFCCEYELIEFIKKVMPICSRNIEHTNIYIHYVRIKKTVLFLLNNAWDFAQPDFLFIYIIKNYLFNSFYFWKILAFISFFSDFIIEVEVKKAAILFISLKHVNSYFSSLCFRSRLTSSILKYTKFYPTTITCE